jgi:hypothetical protein
MGSEFCNVAEPKIEFDASVFFSPAAHKQGRRVAGVEWTIAQGPKKLGLRIFSFLLAHLCLD